MKVLLWVRPGLDTIPGGHLVQARQTVAALRRAGASASLSFDENPDLNVDLVHGIGLGPAAMRRAHMNGVKVVASTIYWSAKYTQAHRSTMRGALRDIRSIVTRGRDEFARDRRAWFEEMRLAFEMPEMLLPNSRLEARAIADELAVSTPMRVVPNAVDEQLFLTKVEGSRPASVLYVGRLEPHKNQLSLIKALRGSGIPLTLVGAAHPHHPGYEMECRAAADSNVVFVNGVQHEDLPAFYAQAAVHAMPSWFETTGLSSLEAALADCSVVTTNRGYVREYFEDDVMYCDPASLRSIRAAVELALSRGPSDQLKGRILDRFTWAHAATATLEAYHHVLSSA